MNIVSLSGGKDSLALWLWAIREGLNPVAVYIDTGWEWSGHHAYLDYLAANVGAFERIAPRRRVVPDRRTRKRRFKAGRRRAGLHHRMPPAQFGARIISTFEEYTRYKSSFPSRVRKWCTEELKLHPFKAWLDRYRDKTGDDVTVLLGIRREESRARSEAKEREWSDMYDCEVWRPILDWPVGKVLAEITGAGLRVHPLYHEGAERVGCWPCVNASKAELSVLARIDPERVARVRELEAEMGATMFTRDRRTEKKRLGDDGPSVVPIGIDEVVKWARTERGGKQLMLYQPRTGCARWGACDAAPVAAAQHPAQGDEGRDDDRDEGGSD